MTTSTMRSACDGEGATHYTGCECHERRHEAIERGLKRELYAADVILRALRRILDVADGDDIIVAARAHASVASAARALVRSGYDGPLMGDEAAPLFRAVRELEQES